MRADSAQHARERKVPHDDLHRVIVAALRDQGHIGMGVNLPGARIGTRGFVQLVYGKRRRNRLRIVPVDCLALVQAHIEIGRQIHGANIGAFAAAGTLVYQNILSDGA